MQFIIHSTDTSKGRLFCGPTVLCMLTGKTRDEVHRDVNKARRKAGKKRRKTIYDRKGNYVTSKWVPWPLTSRVAGMSNAILERLLKKYGLSPVWKNTQYPSLARMIDDMGHFTMPIVVNVTGHYLIYYNGSVYDTLRRSGEPAEKHPCYRRRVKCFWIIRKQGVAHA